MARDHERVIACLRKKSVDELTGFVFDTPSFLTAMGPSRDGVLIPSDFGPSAFSLRKRAHAASYQASFPHLSCLCVEFLKDPPAFSNALG